MLVTTKEMFDYAEKKNFVHIGGTACGDFFDYAKSGICKSEKAGTK